VGCGASDWWNPVKPGLIPVGDGLRNGWLRNEVGCGKVGDGDRFVFGRVGMNPTIPVFVGTSGLSKASLAGTGANGPRGALGLNDGVGALRLELVTNAGGVAEVTGGDTATAG
jgi:hypothetical protein